MSEDMRNALNAFLYRTGESNKRFMIILASNQPEQLDWAINDRVDELVQFPVPGLDERFRIIKQYFNQHIVDHSKLTGAKTISAEGIEYVKIDHLLIYKEKKKELTTSSCTRSRAKRTASLAVSCPSSSWPGRRRPTAA